MKLPTLTMRHLRGLAAVMIAGLVAGTLVASVGSDVAFTQESTPEFTAQLTQTPTADGVALTLQVTSGTAAPSALRVSIDHDQGLTHISCTSSNLLVTCLPEATDSLTLAATTDTAWTGTDTIAEIVFAADPGADDSLLTLTVIEALDQDGTPLVGIASPATISVSVAGPPMCDGQVVTINMNTNGGNGFGTGAGDVILGTPGNDTINGLAGNDTVCAGDGDDTVFGGAGADRIFGESGDCLLYTSPSPRDATLSRMPSSA